MPVDEAAGGNGDLDLVLFLLKRVADVEAVADGGSTVA